MDKDGKTPLSLAAEHGCIEVVKYLVSIGANVEAKDKYGKTPLLLASYYDHLDVIKYLISIGANKDAIDNDGKTPLDYAKDKGRKKLGIKMFKTVAALL